MGVPVVAFQFVLAFESVVAAVFAPDQWTREFLRFGAMLVGIVPLQICHTGYGNGTIVLSTFELGLVWGSEMACFALQ